MQNQFVVHPKDYPFNWDRVKEELERLVETRVLAYVDEPIDWVNQMELATKKDGSLRICIDPQSLNLALKPEHYRLPFLKDTRPDLARAKVIRYNSGWCIWTCWTTPKKALMLLLRSSNMILGINFFQWFFRPLPSVASELSCLVSLYHSSKHFESTSNLMHFNIVNSL